MWMVVAAWFQDYLDEAVHFPVAAGQNLQILVVGHSLVAVAGHSDDGNAGLGDGAQVVERIALEGGHVGFGEVPFGKKVVP